MPQFRKKPVIIEAVQFVTGNPAPSGVCYCGDDPVFYGNPHIHTLEGSHRVAEGDWIITGVKGEQYPCKPDIFDMTYEPVE